MRFAISNIAWSAEEDRRVLRALPEHGCQALEIAPTRILPETPYQRDADLLHAVDLVPPE